MSYIHRNGGLSLLPQASRRRLSSHAEKVKAALELWDYQNRVME
jgi:nuclear pore complex protein Nup133